MCISEKDQLLLELLVVRIDHVAVSHIEFYERQSLNPYEAQSRSIYYVLRQSTC